MPVNSQVPLEYQTLLIYLKRNLKQCCKNNQDLKKQEEFKNHLVKITALLKEPADLVEYLKHLVINVETIFRWGPSEQSKKLIQESLDSAQDLLMGIAQNYKSPPSDVTKIKDVIDIIYQALKTLNGEDDTMDPQYIKKMENLFLPLMGKNQMISFSDKVTTEKFINNAKAFIAGLKNLSPNFVTYLKNIITDLQGVINTGFSARTQDVVLKGVTRLKESIEDLYKSGDQGNKWYYEFVTLLRGVVLRLENDYIAKKLEQNSKEIFNDTRSPQEVYNNQSKKSDSPSTEIAVHLAFVKAGDFQSYKKFFGDINVAIPMECKIDENKPFAEQLPIIWPCKMRYIDALVKKYHTALYPEFKQLDSLVLQLVLFIKNKNNMTDQVKKIKLDDFKKLINPLKGGKKASFLSKIKSVLPGSKKKIEEMIAELKKAIVSDVELYALQ